MSESNASDDATKKADAEKGQSSNEKVWKDSDVKEIIAERQRLKEEKRQREEADKKAQEEKMLSEKKYEELLKQREAELEKERTEKQTLKQKAEAFEEQQKQLREQTLAKIKDGKLKDIAAELSTAKLLEFVDELNNDKGSGFPRKASQSAEDTNPFKPKPGESWRDYQMRTQNLKK